MINVRKAAIIGCGFVGSSIAFSLMQRGLYSELVLIDANQAKAEGEAMDLSHGLPYAASMQIYAGTYDDVADCAMVILTAGANQKPGETRLDLIDKNVAILKSIIPELTRRLNPEEARDRLVNLITGWTHEIKEIMGGMGINSIETLRGNRMMLRGVGLTDAELRILGVQHAGE